MDASLLLGANAIVIFLKLAVHKADFGVFAGGPGQRQSACPHVAVVYVLAIVDVLNKPVAIQAHAGHAHREVFTQRRIDHAAHLPVAVVTHRAIDLGGELARVSLAGDHVDNTTRRVSAVQRALRAAQYFYTLGIKILRLKNTTGGLIHTIDVDAHTVITRWANSARANAADTNIVRGKVLLTHGHVGDRELQVHGVVDQLGIELILSER